MWEKGRKGPASQEGFVGHLQPRQDAVRSTLQKALRQKAESTSVMRHDAEFRSHLQHRLIFERNDAICIFWEDKVHSI